MKIIAVGMNYRAHIQELGDPVPQEPVIFMKPSSAILCNHATFDIPDFSNEIHYETELIVKMSRSGKSVEKQSAHRYYNEITVGIDFTARDMQRTLRAKGNPWELCKAFDHSAAVGEFVNIDQLKERENIEFGLKIGGKEVQHGFSSDMLFDFDEIIAYVSRFITLNEGDLIYTGTPSGIGPVSNGDLLEGYLEGIKVLDISIR